MPRKNVPATDDTLLTRASQYLFQIGRVFGKLNSPDNAAKQNPQLSKIQVVQSIESIQKETQEATVGTIATRLAIDPSTASRLIMQTLEAGYLRRNVSQRDGRAIILEITAQGHELARDAQHYQRSVFDDLTRNWSDTDRNTFAQLFIRFSQEFIETQSSATPKKDAVKNNES